MWIIICGRALVLICLLLVIISIINYSPKKIGRVKDAVKIIISTIIIVLALIRLGLFVTSCYKYNCNPLVLLP